MQIDIEPLNRKVLDVRKAGMRRIARWKGEIVTKLQGNHSGYFFEGYFKMMLK